MNPFLPFDSKNLVKKMLELDEFKEYYFTKKELQEEAENGAIVTTEIEMLMEMCPCKIIGVTGSDGKTTTTSLINHILEKSGKTTFLGGNIGTPLFTKLSKMTSLFSATVSSKIAVAIVPLTRSCTCFLGVIKLSEICPISQSSN